MRETSSACNLSTPASSSLLSSRDSRDAWHSPATNNISLEFPNTKFCQEHAANLTPTLEARILIVWILQSYRKVKIQLPTKNTSPQTLIFALGFGHCSNKDTCFSAQFSYQIVFQNSKLQRILNFTLSLNAEKSNSFI